MLPFVPGLELSRRFYAEAVQPLLERRFPRLRYSAARLDFGSDVLGFDTPRSMDHDWGPRLTLFLAPEDLPVQGEAIGRTLADELPAEVCGIPARFHRDRGSGTRWLDARDQGPTEPWVNLETVSGFCQQYLGIDPGRDLEERDWLAMPAQRLRTIASGAVYHDGLGELEPLRQRLRWYPHDLWLYLLACQWRRIDQEEPFVGRCGEAGDELGSRLVAARQAVELMRLCFLMERRYPPYMKWLGTAFSRLGCYEEVGPSLAAALASAGWQERQEHLGRAYLAVGRRHNALGITDPLPLAVTPFFDRPYLVLHSGDFVDAIYDRITSPPVLALPRYLGAVWQFADSTDALDSIPACRAAAAVYGVPPVGIP
ncbi:MAG: DUF4037 domain-containing protein [Anaerolineae bacterium]